MISKFQEHVRKAVSSSRCHVAMGFTAAIVSFAILCGCHPARNAAVHRYDVVKIDPSDVCSYLSRSEITDAVGYEVDKMDTSTHVLGDNGAPETDCYIQVSGSSSGQGGLSAAFAGFDLSFMTQEDYNEAISMTPTKTMDGQTVTPVLEHVPSVGDDAIWVGENKIQGAVTAHADTIYVRKGTILFCIDPPFSAKGLTKKDVAIALAKLVCSRITKGAEPLAAIKANEKPDDANNNPPSSNNSGTGTMPAPNQNNAALMQDPGLAKPAPQQPAEQQQAPGSQQDSTGSTNQTQPSDSQSGDNPQQGSFQDPSQPQSQPQQGATGQ